MLTRFFWLLPVLFILSCASVNNDPNVLSTAEFKNVTYLAKANQKKNLKEIGTISVTNSGYKANILNTLPDLYRDAIKKSQELATNSGKQPRVYLSNLDFDSFTRREPFQVAYQDCRQDPEMKSVPYQNCYGYGANQHCSTSYRMETTYVNKCETKYKTEIRDVLYQRATANAYVKKEEKE
jgi:hypothetical protein